MKHFVSGVIHSIILLQQIFKNIISLTSKITFAVILKKRNVALSNNYYIRSK